jgi:uncharacterized protein (DUF305 family)
MARQALDEAEHWEIRELAGRIAERERGEIAVMRDLYRSWYSAEVPAAASI